jgi:hypothetical protein
LGPNERVEPRFGHDIHLASEELCKFSLKVHLIEKIGAPPESNQEIEIAFVGRLPAAYRPENTNVARPEVVSDPEHFGATVSHHLTYAKSVRGSELTGNLRAISILGLAAGTDPDHGLRGTPSIRATETA